MPAPFGGVESVVLFHSTETRPGKKKKTGNLWNVFQKNRVIYFLLKNKINTLISPPVHRWATP
ncbi:MAG: hypothetical protein D6714_09845 [Bacteroidetes bacterium]|nr:MAG: hypothetical protein D6714_09845 [Bacteroidota bacterium]